jgi:subtilisin-like proprotein convertase family protein
VRADVSSEPLGSSYCLVGDGLSLVWDRLLVEGPGAVEGLDVDGSLVGDGQEILYAVTVRNGGTDPVIGARVEISAHHGLRLLGADPVRESLYWGNIGPGQEVSGTLSAVVDAGAGPLGTAGLEVRIYDGSHPPAGPSLEWIYVHHDVDAEPPAFVGILNPAYLVGQGTTEVQGYAFDDGHVGRGSGVPTVTLEIRPPSGGRDTLVCPDATPDDGAWSCDWEVTAGHGTALDVRSWAADGLGQEGAPGAWHPFVVDARPPTVTLDLAASGVVSGAVLAGGRLSLLGEVADGGTQSPGGLGSVEVCVEGACEDATLSLAPGRSSVSVDDLAESGLDIDDATLCGGGEIERTFTVTDDFAVGWVALGLNAEHARRGDLRVTVESPQGTRAEVLCGDEQNAGGAGLDVWLEDAAPLSLAELPEDQNPLGPIFEHRARPCEPLQAFLGEPAAGDWILRICDEEPSTADGVYHLSRLRLTPLDTASKAGRWSYLWAPAREDDARRSIAIYGEDLVGNRSDPPVTLELFIDAVPPVISVTQAIPRVFLGDRATVLSGMVTDSRPEAFVSVQIQTPNGETSVEPARQENGTWCVDLAPAAAGTYRLWPIASDLGGNTTVLGPYEVEGACVGAALSVVSIGAEPSSVGMYSMTLTASISNSGSYTLPAGLPIELYADGMLAGRVTTSQPVSPGASEVVKLAWDWYRPDEIEVKILLNEGDDQTESLVLCQAPGAGQQTVSILQVPLAEDWNLMSSYVDPFDHDVEVVQIPIQGSHDVILGPGGAELASNPGLPPWQETLEAMDGEHGYWIKVTGGQAAAQGAVSPDDGSPGIQQAASDDEIAAMLWVVGRSQEEDEPLAVAAGWNLVSYLPRETLPVREALWRIRRECAAVMGFEGTGLSYYPDLDETYNTLSEMVPLHGYWISVTRAVTLSYPSSDGVTGTVTMASSSLSSEDRIAFIRQVEQEAGVQPTYRWMDLLGPAVDRDGEPLPVGTRILAIDPDGSVCGATVTTVEGQYGLMACYGDDPTTSADEGAEPGDVIHFRVNGAEAPGTALGHNTSPVEEGSRIVWQPGERWAVEVGRGAEQLRPVGGYSLPGARGALRWTWAGLLIAVIGLVIAAVAQFGGRRRERPGRGAS